ncbi:hypothetical protein CUMW_035240 [Citrus unshiu]|nr:hypothetical protein CUMW_035240 [Citrus unshiu]
MTMMRKFQQKLCQKACPFLQFDQLVGCCPHNACEGSGSSPHKSIVGAKCSLYPSPLRNASGTSSPVRGYLYWACTS